MVADTPSFSLVFATKPSPLTQLRVGSNRAKNFSIGGVPEWGGLQPRLCSPSTNSKSFAFDADYTSVKVSPAFEKMLKRLGYAPVDWSYEFKGYKVYECPNPSCEVNRVYTPMLATGRFNPYRSRKHASRVASALMDRFEAFLEKTPMDYVLKITLTSPSWVSDGVLGYNTLERFRKAVNYFVRRLGRELFHNHPNARLGGWFAVHPWSSSHPELKHLHAHLVLPNVTYNNKEKRFYRFRPWIDEHLLKMIWQGALSKFGLWNVMQAGLPDVHVEHIKLRVSDNDIKQLKSEFPKLANYPDTLLKRNIENHVRARLVHHLTYIFRRPLADLNANLWEPYAESVDFDRDWSDFLVHYTPRRNAVGFCRRLKSLGFIFHKTSSPRCPICGTRMTYLGRVFSNLPNVPHFQRNRDGSWDEIPPPFDPLPDQTADIVRHRQPVPRVRFDFYEARAKFALKKTTGGDDV